MLRRPRDFTPLRLRIRLLLLALVLTRLLPLARDQAGRACVDLVTREMTARDRLAEIGVTSCHMGAAEKRWNLALYLTHTYTYTCTCDRLASCHMGATEKKLVRHGRS